MQMSLSLFWSLELPSVIISAWATWLDIQLPFWCLTGVSHRVGQILRRLRQSLRSIGRAAHVQPIAHCKFCLHWVYHRTSADAVITGNLFTISATFISLGNTHQCFNCWSVFFKLPKLPRKKNSGSSAPQISKMLPTPEISKLTDLWRSSSHLVLKWVSVGCQANHPVTQLATLLVGSYCEVHKWRPHGWGDAAIDINARTGCRFTFFSTAVTSNGW